LRHQIEKDLEQACNDLNIPWTPFSLERTLKTKSNKSKFADVIHGAVVIEYEPPKSFKRNEGAKFKHACKQAEEYALLMHFEEGRPLNEYILVSWDGESIAFGKYLNAQKISWDKLSLFDDVAAEKLLKLFENDGKPLVHPKILSELVGPESEIGNSLTPKFFESIVDALANGTATVKTKLLYTEWRRLFGQVIGIQSNQLQALLERQGISHGQKYSSNVGEYLFSLNTYIALIAKVIAALSLKNTSINILDHNVDLLTKLQSLEDGTMFSDAGVNNMLVGDFFSWYIDNPNFSTFKNDIKALLVKLDGVDFDVSKKSPDSTRDLFKGMYESFVPREFRHALGEVYTPDWLASHALDDIKWKTENDLLDPTCGSGTFVLEALRRRLVSNGNKKGKVNCSKLLEGIYGIDLNPLAVIAARASIVVYLAPLLNPSKPINVPIYLADAINSAVEKSDTFEHTIQTEKGARLFKVPTSLIRSKDFYPVFLLIKDLINANLTSEQICKSIEKYPSIKKLKKEKKNIVQDTVDSLVELHKEGWDGIWCSILADRFSAGAIKPVSHICGNPPWVKWSHLPPEYANFIKEPCSQRGVFSDDKWVGGIESDISTVITFEAIAKWLSDKGTLAFFITGTVFVNESSQGFRRFKLKDVNVECNVLKVEDYKLISPFEGVTNHPTLLVIKKGQKLKHPIPYIIWEPAKVNGKKKRSYLSSEQFRKEAKAIKLLAKPVKGTDSGPWIIGNKKQQSYWDKIFDASIASEYRARKGVTTDRNGIFFVRTLKDNGSNLCSIENDPSIGRIKGIPTVKMNVHIPIQLTP